MIGRGFRSEHSYRYVEISDLREAEQAGGVSINGGCHEYRESPDTEKMLLLCCAISPRIWCISCECSTERDHVPLKIPNQTPWDLYVLVQPDLFVRTWLHESDCVKYCRTNTNIGCERSSCTEWTTSWTRSRCTERTSCTESAVVSEPDAAVLNVPDRVNHNRTDQTERTKQTIRYTICPNPTHDQGQSSREEQARLFYCWKRTECSNHVKN